MIIDLPPDAAWLHCGASHQAEQRRTAFRIIVGPSFRDTAMSKVVAAVLSQNRSHHEDSHMGPERVMIIRHAEHHDEPGFKGDGTAGQRSLTIRGWQRAGALVGLFGPKGDPGLVPDTVFASAIGKESLSDRPAETVAPLCETLRSERGLVYDRSYLKPDTSGLMRDVMQRSGLVLICWEHSVIPEAIAALPHAPIVPNEWPSGRYDLIWILDRHGPGWRFTERSQDLLAGDTTTLSG